MKIQLRGMRVLPQLQSLRTFMRHAGPHVRELKLDVEAENAPEGFLTALQPMGGGVLHQLGDQLTRLDMELWHGPENAEVVLNDWLLNSLHNLRSLSIHCAGLVMSGGLAPLTALQELRLHQYSGPKILESAVLPQSLTKLVIFEPVGALPQQVGAGQAARAPVVCGAAPARLCVTCPARLPADLHADATRHPGAAHVRHPV